MNISGIVLPDDILPRLSPSSFSLDDPPPFPTVDVEPTDLARLCPRGELGGSTNGLAVSRGERGEGGWMVTSGGRRRGELVCV
jgi:hypothetical protein